METKYKKLIKILNESNLTKIEFEEKGKRYLVERNTFQSVQSISNINNQPNETTKPVVEGTEVTAPIIGSFYESSAPGKKPFVKVGDKVKKDQTLFILEAMKVMNEIKSPCAGVVKEIKFKDGDLVEFGQAIMIIG